ncbi:MAG TPA: peptide deformylase [Rickettsiales bacterium]|nr:peptide deformylase [Rickettsiales bacterium]
MKLKIVEVPDKLLKQKSNKVEFVDNKIKTLIDNMIETMYKDNGVGLSAVQVGELLRIVVIDVREGEKDKKNPMVFINPEVIYFSPEKELMEEGCLSVPGQHAEIIRSPKVEVKYQDIDMIEKNLKAEGLLAQCLQHEIDHTNGILYIDYLSKLKRDNLLKKLEKTRKFKK